ncbi:MAG TPA: aldo/keto reductase [Anaerolineales bacterium]|nr:aldo/keto reductase [Anaerolineales bacterium]
MNISLEKIDPSSIPHRKLYTGAEIPAVGLGTFGSDRFTASQIAEAVLGAAAIGYRHFDCASVYGNEKEIGASFQKIMSSGIRRDELWVTSKLWNDKHAEEAVIPTCRQTLKDLQLEYLDLYLIHWPFPNHHAPGVDVNSRDPHAVPYIHENYMKTWRQMEKLVEIGLVRQIGTSNMTAPKLKLLLRDAKIKPAANEMELHPHFQQPELFQFCIDNHIAPIGFSPIGSPTRPDRDRTPEDTVDIEDPVIIRIAERLNVHPAVICIKWAVQRGQIPIPFSIYPEQYWSNLKAAASAPLTDEDMQAIAGIDKNNRLIKGQVFLWESAKDWQDLWDLDGQITSA